MSLNLVLRWRSLLETVDINCISITALTTVKVFQIKEETYVANLPPKEAPFI
jgi:hypothetical protein